MNKEKTNEKHGMGGVEVPGRFVVRYLSYDIVFKKILLPPGKRHRRIPEEKERNGTK